MGLGVVEALYLAHAAGEPMTSLATAELVAGAGITGDRYATGGGHWSDPKWPDQQLTLVEAELAEELGLPLHALRRNVVTRGIELGSLVGQEFRVGSAVLRGVRACDPCRYIETLARPGLFADLAGRGGLRAAVLVSGKIAVRDAVVLDVEAPQAHELRTRNQEP